MIAYNDLFNLFCSLYDFRYLKHMYLKRCLGAFLTAQESQLIMALLFCRGMPWYFWWVLIVLHCLIFGTKNIVVVLSWVGNTYRKLNQTLWKNLPWIDSTNMIFYHWCHELILFLANVHETIHEDINLRGDLNFCAKSSFLRYWFSSDINCCCSIFCYKPLSVALLMHLHRRRSANICVYI